MSVWNSLTPKILVSVSAASLVCGVIKPTIRHNLIDLHEFSGDFVIQVFGCRQPLTNPGVELTLFFGIATRRVDELIMFK